MNPLEEMHRQINIAAKFLQLALEIKELIKTQKQQPMKDLTKILKDGDEVYYTVTGSTHIVKLKKYFLGTEISICNNDEVMAEIDHLNENGSKNEGGECLIFPSKEERNWDNFKRKEEFKKGDLCLFWDENSNCKFFGLFYKKENNRYCSMRLELGRKLKNVAWDNCEKINIEDYI